MIAIYMECKEEMLLINIHQFLVVVVFVEVAEVHKYQVDQGDS